MLIIRKALFCAVIAFKAIHSNDNWFFEKIQFQKKFILYAFRSLTEQLFRRSCAKICHIEGMERKALRGECMFESETRRQIDG